MYWQYVKSLKDLLEVLNWLDYAEDLKQMPGVCVGMTIVSGCQPTRPLQNAPFCPIAVSGSNYNPRNIQDIPPVKVFAFPELE
jgi:hypothetical protein